LDKLLFFFTLFCTFAPLIAIFAFTPYITRKGTYFGVLLNEDAKNHPRIKKINLIYTYFAIIVGCVLSLTQIFYMSYLVLQISIFVYVMLCVTLYFLNNRLIKNLITVEKWDNMQKEIHLNYVPKSNLKNTLSPFWYLIYIVIIVATILITLKTPKPFGYVLPCIQAIILITMLAIHSFIAKSNYYADKTEIENSIEYNIYFRRKWSIFTFISGLSINIVLSLLQLNFLGIIKNTAVLTSSPFAVTIIITISAIIFAVRKSK